MLARLRDCFYCRGMKTFYVLVGVSLGAAIIVTIVFLSLQFNNLPFMPRQVIDAVNVIRAQHGLPELVENGFLDSAADQAAYDNGKSFNINILKYPAQAFNYVRLLDVPNEGYITSLIEGDPHALSIILDTHYVDIGVGESRSAHGARVYIAVAKSYDTI